MSGQRVARPRLHTFSRVLAIESATQPEMSQLESGLVLNLNINLVKYLAWRGCYVWTVPVSSISRWLNRLEEGFRPRIRILLTRYSRVENAG